MTATATGATLGVCHPTCSTRRRSSSPTRAAPARQPWLSGGQRQSIAISRALFGEPGLVIVDEPTAALGVIQTGRVLELIRRLCDRGLGVVVISHNLANAFHVADRIVVLRLGRRVATFDRRTITSAEVVAAITGAEPLPA